MKMFIDTVHFSTVNHYGVVLNSEGFVLGETEMFRTKEQAWNAAHALRDLIMTKDAETVEQNKGIHTND